MENAITVQEGKALWEATNNTVGFNHMWGSAADAKAMVAETMYGYSAYFLDDDPREANATYTDPNTGSVTKIGFPMKEAVWRTNHGYDPIIREHFLDPMGPTSWTFRRHVERSLEFTDRPNVDI